MEKYGVCNTCYGRPADNEDLKGFTKTASGDLECTACGQIVSGSIIEPEVKTAEIPNETQSDI